MLSPPVPAGALDTRNVVFRQRLMWVDGILEGTPIPFGVEEGIQFTELMHCACLAAKEQRQVDIPVRA